MLLHIPEVLTYEDLAQCRQTLERAEWIDGRITAGHQSGLVKDNSQIPESHPAARQLGDLVLASLERVPLFMTAALPLKVFPPLFNRYDVGQSFGTHVDNAIRQVAGTPNRVRTDLSSTLFLNDPGEYDGGELVVEDAYGVHEVKLPAGDLVLYPAGSLHHVRPVTRGTRVACFFWVQSMVRDDGRRAILLDLDMAIQRLIGDQPGHPSVAQLIGIYHNLLRRWADT